MRSSSYLSVHVLKENMNKIKVYRLIYIFDLLCSMKTLSYNNVNNFKLKCVTYSIYFTCLI